MSPSAFSQAYEKGTVQLELQSIGVVLMSRQVEAVKLVIIETDPKLQKPSEGAATQGLGQFAVSSIITVGFK